MTSALYSLSTKQSGVGAFACTRNDGLMGTGGMASSARHCSATAAIQGWGCSETFSVELTPLVQLLYRRTCEHDFKLISSWSGEFYSGPGSVEQNDGTDGHCFVGSVGVERAKQKENSVKLRREERD